MKEKPEDPSLILFSNSYLLCVYLSLSLLTPCFSLCASLLSDNRKQTSLGGTAGFLQHFNIISLTLTPEAVLLLLLLLHHINSHI